MNFREVFEIINQMRAEGVIEAYAIGGAVAATFYLEPFTTLDVDVFIDFRAKPESLIVTTTHVFDYLKERGGVMEREYIVLAGTPVQLLAPNSPLVEEALDSAVVRDVDGIPVRVFTAEHLAAIALQTGRARDRARLVQFIEENALDLTLFLSILARHGLNDKWRTFERQLREE